MTDESGRCLCGAVAYRVGDDPLRVTMCHCRFCQRATGGAYMVEPVFARSDFAITQGAPDVVGVYGGTFDDPDWFERSAQTTKHIFLDVAQAGSVIPAGINTFRQHATENDGTAIPPHVFSSHHLIG